MKVVRFVLKPAVILLLFVPFQGHARHTLESSYKDMLAKSDLVVIANPVDRTTDTKEETYLPGIFLQDKNGKQSRIKAIGVETKFTVLAVLKGDATSKQVTLHHYREAEPSNALNQPFLVYFDPSDISKRRSYLLFLVHEPDGRFAPFGGQTDPGMKSILPIPFELHQAAQ